MLTIKLSGIVLCLLLVFSSCASTGSAASTSAVPAVTTTSNSGGRGGQPDWIRDPYVKFDKQIYVAARGSGDSPQAAEKNALRNLVAIFGQSIQVDEKVSTAYMEAVQNGVTANWTELTSIDTGIVTSTGMESLVGAEIGDTWYDGKSEYYAAALLNKTKALQVYSKMVNENKALIANLTDIPSAEKNTLDGFARYQLAATIADVTISYGNLLAYIGAPLFAQGLKPGDDYRLEALNITKAIPVNVTVTNDKAGRIQGAFAKSFSGLGFRSGGDNARYTLEANVTISPVDLPQNPNKFVRIEVSANLRDTAAGTVLLPYNFNSREGHTTVSEAENRAVGAAERKINEEYAKLLNNYLAQLTPKRK